jgi:hypothetical protein
MPWSFANSVRSALHGMQRKSEFICPSCFEKCLTYRSPVAIRPSQPSQTFGFLAVRSVSHQTSQGSRSMEHIRRPAFCLHCTSDKCDTILGQSAVSRLADRK